MKIRYFGQITLNKRYNNLNIKISFKHWNFK